MTIMVLTQYTQINAKKRVWLLFSSRTVPGGDLCVVELTLNGGVMCGKPWDKNKVSVNVKF